jgi:hypothetical protein
VARSRPGGRCQAVDQGVALRAAGAHDRFVARSPASDGTTLGGHVSRGHPAAFRVVSRTARWPTGEGTSTPCPEHEACVPADDEGHTAGADLKTADPGYRRVRRTLTIGWTMAQEQAITRRFAWS